MTFLEALYGSQYYEISQKGRDGNKGRLNGNVFLSAFIIIIIFLLIAMLMFFSPAFKESYNNSLQPSESIITGKSLGKLIAIPLFAVIYLIVSKTVGSELNFTRTVDSFMQYPEMEKEKATAKVLAPFFIALVLLLVFSLID